MKNVIKVGTLLFLIGMISSSCAARKNRKCNGQKGIKTPMGTMEKKTID